MSGLKAVIESTKSWGDEDGEMEFGHSAGPVTYKPYEPAAKPAQVQSRNTERRDERPRREEEEIVQIPNKPPFKALFRGVKFEATAKDLKSFLQMETVEVIVPRDKGIAFIEFSTPELLRKALDQFDGKTFMGRTLQVVVAKPFEKDPRRHDNGRSNFPVKNDKAAAPKPVAPVVATPASPPAFEPLNIVPKANKPNPFGAAKPREVVLQERAASVTSIEPMSEKDVVPSTPDVKVSSEKSVEKAVADMKIQEKDNGNSARGRGGFTNSKRDSVEKPVEKTIKKTPEKSKAPVKAPAKSSNRFDMLGDV